ncbi:HAD family hydrolase [Ammonifex thiophilus]|uniref:phosphoserine phosphatase n=2 Tax=Ammonifex thiophilus TaxID=444093 RepID=A0A3D8P764_9THEO|nr:HAD family hydrolase [Ammonifex thiophilus]
MKRRIKGVIFDLDGTLTPVTSIWQYIHECLGTWETHGRKHLEDFLTGRINYEEFARRDVGAWRGVPKSYLEELVSRIPYRKGAKELVAALKERGVRTFLLSSGLDLLASRVAEELGFDCWVANGLGFTQGRVDGRVFIRVPWHGKPQHVPDFCSRFGLRPEELAAVGDSCGDVPLFSRVGLAVAVSAPPEVREQAHIQVEDLQALLPAVAPLLPDGEGVERGSWR